MLYLGCKNCTFFTLPRRKKLCFIAGFCFISLPLQGSYSFSYMIPFKDISIEDKAMVQAYTLSSSRRNCDLSFSNLYSWRFLYHTQVAETGGFLLIKFRAEGHAVYMMPVGEGDLRPVLTAMKEDAEAEGETFRMQGVCSHMRADLEQVAPDCFAFTADRDYYDYIYLRSDLATLRGKKYQPKRNHINRFVRMYPDYEYRELTPDLIPECLQLAEQWCRTNETTEEERRELEDEHRSLTDALLHFEQLDLLGGVLHVDGHIVAFTFGTPINRQTFDVCVEKADVKVEGSYAMINYEFANRIPEQYTFVNREEDLGLEGLRKAKLSYYPEMLLEKWIAVCTK